MRPEPRIVKCEVWSSCPAEQQSAGVDRAQHDQGDHADDQGKVVDELLKLYAQLDDEFQAALPLKRIWTVSRGKDSE